MELRQANVEDADEIVALVNRAYRGESSKRGWTTEADLLDGTRTDRNDIVDLITPPKAALILCTTGDTIVGSVHVEKRRDECYLSMLVVEPELQGGGVGKVVMQAAEAHARDVFHSTKMIMSVITIRTELIAFYERRGYLRTGKIKPFVFDDVHGIARVDGIELEVLEKDL